MPGPKTPPGCSSQAVCDAGTLARVGEGTFGWAWVGGVRVFGRGLATCSQFTFCKNQCPVLISAICSL